MSNDIHHHDYPNLDRTRIYEFLQLILLNRSDIFYQLLYAVNAAKAKNEWNAKNLKGFVFKK